MRKYHFLLKNVNKYYKFTSENNNQAIQHLAKLGTSYSYGELCELVFSSPNDTDFVNSSTEITSKDLSVCSHENVRLGYSNTLAVGATNFKKPWNKG